MNPQLRLSVVGIDVSKASLAICYLRQEQVQHLEVSNSKAGFQQLVKTCGAHCLFVMEATGTYYLAVAYYLHEQGGHVAVLNPLVIKRFIQMHLSKEKVTARMRSSSCATASSKPSSSGSRMSRC